jgi:apolipoprotein N-acyltransferase
VVDGLGRIVAQLPLGVEGVLDAPLPTSRPPTFYSRFGAAAPLAIGLAFLLLALVAKRRARN